MCLTNKLTGSLFGNGRLREEKCFFHNDLRITTLISMDTSLRLDKWLWAARFYKTRKFATDAINGGKVHVNGRRTKPGKDVKIGTKIKISKDRFTWDITVAGTNTQRRPAKEAILLFDETKESHARRQKLVAKIREEKHLYASNKGKPNKKERRLIHRFKGD